ncbi:MAG TPA: BTAD domain-containing putative transcriptional regulator [Chloroflexaceae bacterium]|nr:BTAD domain-containing putative transcriptional regulator [Chloroflexaceae bacterium]
MRQIAIRLLGPFEATGDGAPLTGFAYAKVRALLAYLAVEPGPHPREALAALLWPDQPERAARASLSQALTTLRGALGDRGADEALLLADVHHVRLSPEAAVEVDALRLLAALAEAEAHAHRSWRTCARCAGRLREAAGLYRGPFLADLAIPDSDVFEEWATLQREHLLQRALSALERLVERELWRGAYAEGLSHARRLVALDPLLEVSQRALMGLLALNGETAAALAHYRQLEAMLARELGAEPEEATAALYEQIRRGEPAGLAPAPPPFRVPQPPAALVGRAEALEAICAQLREGRGRALTITGAGGIGKTRLAIEAAHALRHDFEDGVFLVELAALGDPALLADAVARALGVKERPRQPIGETLRETLRERHLLLILDNFEHVVAAAPLVAELLAACPDLSVLATSRAPLMVRPERQLALEPLADDEAVGLFLQRAQAAGAGLPEDEASARVYSAICARLDRLPLAIELIAVRARTLTPRELLRRLDQPLQAAAHGPRDAAPRHRSLRDAIQWSYDLLGPEERRVFRSLGVFAGGCTAEAAQAVLGPAADALPMIEALTQASLLQRQEVAEQTRFLSLATIREFALEQLDRRDEDAAVRQRHAEHFARFAMAAYEELLRPEAPRWRAWVAAEHDNLRAAFRWALEHGRYETALRIATGIWRFHSMAGSLREGLERLEAALAYGDQVPLAVRCDALRAAGILASNMNDYPRARRWLEAAVEDAWRLGDQAALQPILTNLGYALLEQGELEDARVHLEVSLSLAQRGADPALAKFPLFFLANLHRRLGDHDQAQLLGEECLRINQERQDPEGIANALVSLGTIVLARGDAARAHALADQALALHRTLNHQLGIGLDFALLGDLARARGEHTVALAHYQRCLDLWRERGNTLTGAPVRESVAQTLGPLGEPVRAATLVSAAAAIRERAAVRLSPLEQAAFDETARACRAALGEEAYAAAKDAGLALSLAQAIDLALAPPAPALAD